MNVRSMIVRSMIVTLLIVTACTSEKKRAYEQVARQANSLFTAMKPTAIKMTSFAGDPTAASASVIAACKSADEQLWLLRKVRFDADGIDSQPSYPRVSEFAEQLLDRRPVFCRPDNGSAQRILSCREWCIETWTELVSAVDRLRNAAKKEDVNIVSLTQPE